MEENHTYSCAIAKGPLTVAVTMLEFQKHPPVLYTQLSGLWILKGNADAVFTDNTGATIFEWHPRRALKPRCVARTLDGQFSTISIPFSIYTSKLVSLANPSKISSLLSPMSPKRAIFSDEPGKGFWPTTLDYGEPCDYRKPSSAHKDIHKTRQPAKNLGKPCENASKSAGDEKRIMKLQLLAAPSMRPSRVSGVGLASLETPVAYPSNMSMGHELELEHKMEARKSRGKKPIVKRQRDIEDENCHLKRQRTACDHDTTQSSYADHRPLASIKKETVAPVLKRGRDSDSEGPTVKRQRLKPEDEDVQMVDVDSELDLDI